MSLVSFLAGSADERTDTRFACGMLIVRLCPDASHLERLRMLFLVQAIHSARHESPAFEAAFLSSAMGPMDERLLSIVKRSGMRHLRARPVPPISSTVDAVIREVCGIVQRHGMAWVHAAIHRDDGAWSRRWTPDPSVVTQNRRSRGRHPRSVHSGAAIHHQDLVDEGRAWMPRPAS